MIESKIEVEVSGSVSIFLKKLREPKEVLNLFKYTRDLEVYDSESYSIKISFPLIPIAIKYNCKAKFFPPNEITHEWKSNSPKTNIKFSIMFLNKFKDRSKIIIRGIYDGPFEGIMQRRIGEMLDHLASKIREGEVNKIIEINHLEDEKLVEIIPSSPIYLTRDSFEFNKKGIGELIINEVPDNGLFYLVVNCAEYLLFRALIKNKVIIDEELVTKEGIYKGKEVLGNLNADYRDCLLSIRRIG